MQTTVPAPPADVYHRRWHALDAPFTPLAAWLLGLERGTCTRCGRPARRGLIRWWHLGAPCRFDGRMALFRGL